MADKDLLTLDEARTAVNLADNGQDTQLQLFLTGLSSRVDKLCGPVVSRAVSDELHDGGKPRIWFDFTPVFTVSTITEYRHTTATVLSAESNVSKPADGYLLDNAGVVYYAWRRSGGADTTFPTGRRNIAVTYNAGRYADTGSVDEQFKVAAAAILRRVWKREQAIWAQRPGWSADLDNPAPTMGFFKAFDPMIRELLADQLLPVVGI